MKKLTLFLLNMVVMTLFSINAIASQSTYYGKCTVHSTGKGLVYVNKSNDTESAKYAVESSAENSKRANTSDGSAALDFYRFVKPEAGYKLAGWFTNKECTEGLDKDSKVQISATSTDVESPTLVSYWAKFVEKDPITDVLVYDHAEAVDLDGHSEVSIEQADSIVVKVDDSSESATVVLRMMEPEVGEESTTWVPGQVVYEGQMTVKNSVARVEFPEPILLYRGVKYQGEITVTDVYGVKDSIAGTFNGSYVEPLISEVALEESGLDVTLSNHSEIAVEHAEAIKAYVSAAAKTATYVVRNMVQKAGEESSSWVATDTIAADTMSINTVAYAEFKESLTFNSGSKYQVTVTVVDGEKNEMIADYIINGSYSEPLISEAYIASYGAETELSNHSANVLIDAQVISANVAAGVRTATYAICNMKQVVGEESSSWVATDTIEHGEMALSGKAYAELKKPIIFVQGKKYMVIISAIDANDAEETAEYIIDGGFEPEKEVVLTYSVIESDKEYYLYNEEYEGFMVGANDWGTRASVSREKGLKVKITAKGETYKIGAMSPDNEEGIWIDGSRDGNEQFTLSLDEKNNTYTIGNTKFPESFMTWTGDENNTRLNFTKSAKNGTWGAVTQEDYDAYWQTLVEAEEAKGIYTRRTSNDKAKWVGASGVYGGGAERYIEGGLPQGDIMVQTINNLPVGMYEVTFAAISNVARNLDVAKYAGDGIAYAFANKTQKDITVGTKSALNDDDWKKGTYTLTAKVDEDGILKYGIANHKAGSQWAVVKVVSLTKLEDYEEPMISEASLLVGDDRIALDENSEIELEQATGIVAHTAPSVREASYVIYEVQKDGANWTPGVVVASGEMSINAIAYAELQKESLPVTVSFYEGTMYQVEIAANDARMESDTVRYIVKGTYRDPQISEAYLVSGAEEITLNSHSEVSVEQAEAIAAKVSAPVREASYVIATMKQEKIGEESSKWVVDETIAEGEMSINGTAYAEFDEAIIFDLGTKYQITINTVDADKNKESVSYVINGAYHIPLVTEATITTIEGSEVALNLHSEVTAESVTSVKASVDASVREASYVVRNMMEIAGEESSQWVATDTIAADTMLINGIAFAELDSIVTFYSGSKYQFTINAKDAEGFEAAADFIINGGYVEPLISETALVFGGEETALNNHSSVSVEIASAVAVKVLASVREASYVVRNMEPEVGEESTQWVAADTIATGAMSINGTAYAEFGDTLIFYKGNKYQITINATDAADREESADYIIDGSYLDPLITDVYVSAFGVETSLNTHSEASVINIDKLGANVFPAVQEVSYAIKNMKLQDNEWVATDVIAEGEMLVRGKATAELKNLINCEKGKKYMIALTAKAPERIIAPEETVEFVINGAFVNAYDYTVRMSNDHSDWVGSTGSYEGGAEHYNGDGLPEGDILVQTIKELPAGLYEVTFAALSNVARGQHPTGKNISYAFANESAGTLEVGTKSELKPEDWAEGTITLTATVAEDGVLTYGIRNEKAGSQWAVAKAISLILVEPYVPEDSMIIEAAIVDEGEEYTLTSHSEVSVKHSDAIIAKVAASVRSAYHVVRNMEYKDNSWVATDVIVEGDMSINGIAYAADTLTFEAGKKYQVEIVAIDAKNYSSTATYIINGAYLDPLVLEAMIVSGADSLTLTTHSSVSAEAMDYIQATVAAGVQSAKYSVFEMAQNEDLQWTPAEYLRKDVEMQLHGMASAVDSLVFYAGKRYAIEITAECPLGGETVQYLIDGAYVKPAPTSYEPKYSAFVADGTKEFYLYNVESKSFVKGGNDWGTRASGFRKEGNLFRFTDNGDGTYTFADKIGADWKAMFTDDQAASIWVDNASRAESKTWTVTELPNGTYHISNTAVKSIPNALLSVSPYLSDSRLYFQSEGSEVLGQTWAFVAPEDYDEYIAGLDENMNLMRTTTEPGTDITRTLPVMTSAMDGWSIDNTSTFHLNTWSWEGLQDGTWMTPSFVENWVAKGSLLPEGTISYTIKDLVPGQAYDISAYIRAYNEGNLNVPEGAYFYAGDVQSEDISNGKSFEFNGMAGVYGTYTAMNAVADEAGNITIGIVEKNNNFNWIAIRDIKVVVATPEPVIAEAILVDAEDNEFALNTHSAISMKEQATMIVRFGEPAKVASATYAIQAIVGYDEETGAPILGVPTWGEFSINTYGYAEQAYTYAYGVQYQITIEATLKDETVVSEKYLVNGAYEPEALEANITGEGTTLNVIYAVGTDLGDQNNDKPYILDAEGQKIEVAEYATDNTTGEFFDPLNKIIISLNEALADGKYTLVLPAGMFIVNGGDLNEEWRYEFTVEGGNYTAINSIAGSKNVADGKYLENGQITIVKNGVKYQISGARK